MALLAGCGGAAHTISAHAGQHTARATRSKASKPVSVRVAYHRLFSLPAPLRDPASAAIGPDRFVLLGGLDASDVSAAGIEVASLRRVLRSYALPLAQHDAQAAALDGKVYVFGGGSLSELDHILSFDPATGAVHQVGQLPHSQSDVAVAALGQTAYIVGGYDGVDWLNTILAWRPGSQVRVAGHLPVGLRYSAVAAADGRLLVIGGSTPTRASRAIYSFDPASGTVRRIGRLPRPITHASAATLGSSVYLIGGRGDLDNAQTAAVWAIDPRTGQVRVAGRLPTPLSDSGVLTVGGRIVVAGGLEPTGATGSTVAELVPAR
ncbi:MAG TPA: kelch repeat-containing protein [Solirubrobacteraceae bacterium]|nr:kelch repeat-containing protein [Solirubrobacteraceae bacterium]